MASSTIVKAVSLVVFLGAVAGAAYGVQVYLGDGVSAQLVNADPMRDTLNVTGGHTVTYAVEVTNRASDDQTLAVRLQGDVGEGTSDARSVPAGGAHVFFVPVEVAEDAAAGDHALTSTILRDGEPLREREAAATLRVLEPGPAYEQGDEATVIYTGRLAETGQVFNTNDPVLEGAPFPKTDSFSQSPGLLTVRSVPRPSVVEGFYEGVVGMQPGESRTVTFPPEKGYGNATITETQERLEELEREFVLELNNESVQREVFNDYVNQTGQGEGASFAPGDIFHYEQGANRWPYRILTINDTVVEYRLRVEAGQTFTLYPFWENASEVVRVNETHAVFRTTPTTQQGDMFTMRGYWENMSEVAEVTNDTIVVRHSPPEGLQYQVPQGGFGEPLRYTVTEVTEDAIVVSRPSGSQLAGQTLTFDILLVELTK